jgi:hypothetical protein
MSGMGSGGGRLGTGLKAPSVSSVLKGGDMLRQPSLVDQRDYFRAQAGNVLLPRAERDQWQRLADELNSRIPEGTPDEDQLELW